MEIDESGYGHQSTEISDKHQTVSSDQSSRIDFPRHSLNSVEQFEDDVRSPTSIKMEAIVEDQKKRLTAELPDYPSDTSRELDTTAKLHEPDSPGVNDSE